MRIFISYGRDEHVAIAKRLSQDLTESGHHVWFDADRLKPGQDWEFYIEEGLDWIAGAPEAGRILFLMTPHSVRRPDGYCLNELARALSRRLTIVPVMLVWCEPPLSICRIQWLDMQDCIPLCERERQYAERFAQLLEALKRPDTDVQRRGRLVRMLEPLPCEADLLPHLTRFTGRRWFIERIDEWLAKPDESRIFWIVGKPGVGKTALAAWLCWNRPEIKARHVCQHGHVQKSDPRRCIMSIAYQLGTQLKEYQTRLNDLNLEEIVPASNARTLFDMLITQPLSRDFPAPDNPVAILIDALDEASQGGKNEIAEVVASEFNKTPRWLRMIVTSRPEPSVELPMQGPDRHVLEPSAMGNEEDIREFLSRELSGPGDAGYRAPATTIENILERSDGLFLYIEWVRREIDQGRLSLDRLDDFPKGLGGVYARFFRRQFPEVDAYKRSIRPALEVIVATQDAVQTEMLASIMGWDEYEVCEVCDALGALFPLTVGQVQPFHRSVIDWLTNRDKAGPYYVSERKGHQRLADYGWGQYESGVKLMKRYFLSLLPLHLAHAERWSQLAQFLSDHKVTRARCASEMVYDIVRDLAMLLRLERPMDQVVQSLVNVFKDNLFERLRQQLRSALNQFFGLYDMWPLALRENLERSSDLTLVLFLGDTHDMEERFDEAEAVFRRLLASTDPDCLIPYATACARLAYTLEHQDRPQEGLEITEQFNAQPDVAERCNPVYYWWVQYQRAVNLRRLYRYDEAIALLKQIRAAQVHGGHGISALHQLGVIDLELGRLEQAEAKFKDCLAERGQEKWNHRTAFEYRRLGEIYALSGRTEEARTAFEQALTISNNCGNQRYVAHVRKDLMVFLDVPDWLRREKLEKLSLPALANRFAIDESQLKTVFRVLWEQNLGYLPVICRDTGAPTGEAVRWDVAHSQGYWHATAMVLIIDNEGEIALQERSETDSKGELDVSVSGHLEIGETDTQCAIRETAEEVGVVTSPAKLVRLGEPFQLIKEGDPEVEADGHEDRFLYRYATNKVNRERSSVFILKVSDKSQLDVLRDGPEETRIHWLPLIDAANQARSHPELFASAFKQLLHAEILHEIQEIIRRGRISG